MRDPTSPAHRSQDGRCVIAFIISFLLCFALAAAAYHLPQFKAFRPPAARARMPRDSKNYYVGYAHGGADEYDIYFTVNGAANALKKAEVLFLGSSRTKYAFKDQKLLHGFFDRRHLRYFNLGFGYGEPSPFALDIIRKYDLRPKWVIVNADPFFTAMPSYFAAGVLKANWFDAWKFNFETAASYDVEHLIHSAIPYIDITQWTAQADGVEFRSKKDGTIVPGGMLGSPSDVAVDSIKQTPRADPYTLHLAKEFEQEMTARGTRMVLTWVPTSPNLPRPLVRLADVPIIVPRLTGLHTVDGSHLDIPSARRFCAAVLDKLAPIIDRRGR